MTDTDPNATEQDRDLAQNLAAGLRNLAQFIELNPELAYGFEGTFARSGINVHLRYQGDAAADLAEYAQAAARYGAEVTKDIDDRMHNLYLDFAGVKAHVLAYREEVCERVVTGVETVTKTVPDPEALAAVPQVEITEDVELVEWRCRPLLASEVS